MRLTFSDKEENQNLPWWTWIVPFFIFQIGSIVSLLFKFDTGIGSLYLPTAFAVILVNWWGLKRTLPALYISSLILTPFWGVDLWWQWFIYPICETSYAFFSWFLFTKLARGQYWLPNTRQFVLFLFVGLLVPLIFDLLSLQALLTLFHEQPNELFWIHFLRNWLGEFTSNFGICAPVLYSLTHVMQRKKWLLKPPPYQLQGPKYEYNRLVPIAIYVLLFCISFIVPFEKYWFLYGLGGLYIAIQFGFGEALFCNFFIFLITYVIPNFSRSEGYQEFSNVDPIMNLFLGNLLLYIFVAFTGRVISDLRLAEEKLNVKYVELKQTNNELDKFVYSVSHDLSAPLKSIQGLINISKIDISNSNKELYLSKIEQSVSKLDLFIKEILDYSRNNRIESVRESINLNELMAEIIESLKFIENYQQVTFEFSETENCFLTTDKVRLRIILNNLISNAIKFQRRVELESSTIHIGFRKDEQYYSIRIRDNGEGIKPELMPKIFDMFFRGTENHYGSGLGLYIAKEAVEKLGGKIEVDSVYGKGSTFIVSLPIVLQ